MFLGLTYTSPTYEVAGVGTFQFRCRFPNEAEMLEYSAEVEQIVEAAPADTPASKGQRSESRKAIAEAVTRHVLPLIDSMTFNGSCDPDGWKEELTSPDRPGFVGSMLRAVGFHLFRGATEQSYQGAD